MRFRMANVFQKDFEAELIAAASRLDISAIRALPALFSLAKPLFSSHLLTTRCPASPSYLNGIRLPAKTNSAQPRQEVKANPEVRAVRTNGFPYPMKKFESQK
ncbi:hypothetical protein CEXT_207811 [Caerostris extrusa]|uniref:Uncharacterized protein n=1 Tax=Caerostris extrusa TaxID=172846 RepID=A0AAV4TG21_CAEEX|nr:hypothetical protein CEXT_207811 [Caerostris extrusa]